MEIRRASEHTAMPWANGRGVSHEIFRLVDESGEWLWRIAIAPIVEDGPFSLLPGVHRELTLIEGSGLVLTIDGEQVHVVNGGVVRFSGSSVTSATLTDGPVVDLNVMSRESHEMVMQVIRGSGVIGEFVCAVALDDSTVNLGGEEIGLASRDAVVGDGSGLRLVNGRIATVHVRR